MLQLLPLVSHHVSTRTKVTAELLENSVAAKTVAVKADIFVGRKYDVNVN